MAKQHSLPSTGAGGWAAPSDDAARDRPRPARASVGRSRSVSAPPPWLLAAGAVVAVVSLLPLAYLVARTSGNIDAATRALWRPKTLQVVANTAGLVAAVSGSAVALAVPLAWLTARTTLPGRRVWATVFTLPLVIPSFVVALAFVAAMGPHGLLQHLLAPFGVSRLPSVYGFAGSWLVLTFATMPYAFLALRAAFLGLDASQEEAARSLGLTSRQAFRRVTLPHLRPAMAVGGLFAALYTLGDFGVVTLLRYDAFTRAIYTSYRASFDRTAAAGLALVLVLLAAGLLVGETAVRGRVSLHRVGVGTARTAPPVPLGRWRAPALAFCAAVATASLALPIAVLVYWCARSVTLEHASPHLFAAARTSLLLGGGAALAAALGAVPIAVLSVRHRSALTHLLERSTYVTYALPGIVIAVAYVAITVRTPWYQTFAFLVLACATRYLAQAVGATRLSLLQVNPRLEEAARGLGCSAAGATRRVTVPLVRPGLLAGVLLVFLATMKELPITLLLIPTGGRTLPTLIWTAAGDARYGEAALPALLLVAVTAVPTFLLARRQQAATS